MEKRLSKTIVYFLVFQWFIFAGWVIFQVFQHDLSRDDFWYLTFTRSKDLLHDLDTWFKHSNGRYFTAILQITLFYLPTTWIYPAIIGGFLMFLLVSAFFHIMRYATKLSHRILLWILFFELVILGLPAKSDTLFWPSGIFSHSIGLLFLLPILFPNNKQTQVTLLSAVAIPMAGIGETAGLIFFLILLTQCLEQKNLRLIVPILIFLAGWFGHFLIPASSSRLDQLHDQSRISFIHAFFATGWQNLKLLPQTLGIAVLWGMIRFTFKLPTCTANTERIIFVLSSYWLVYLLFIAFIMKDAEPARASLFIHLITWYLMGLVFQRWFGFLLNKQKVLS